MLTGPPPTRRYDAMLAITDELDAAEARLCDAADALAAATRTVLVLLRRTFTSRVMKEYNN